MFPAASTRPTTRFTVAAVAAEGIRGARCRRVTGEHHVATVGRQRQVSLRRRRTRHRQRPIRASNRDRQRDRRSNLAAVGSALLDEDRRRDRRQPARPGPTRTTRNVSALHVSVPSHAFDPSAAQMRPARQIRVGGDAAVHRSEVQASPSTGLSVLSATRRDAAVAVALGLLAVAGGVGFGGRSRRGVVSAAGVVAQAGALSGRSCPAPGQLAAVDALHADRRRCRSRPPFGAVHVVPVGLGRMRRRFRPSTRRRCSRCRRRRAGRCCRGPR